MSNNPPPQVKCIVAARERSMAYTRFVAIALLTSFLSAVAGQLRPLHACRWPPDAISASPSAARSPMRASEGWQPGIQAQPADRQRA